MKTWDKILGFLLLVILLVGGQSVLPSNMHFVRLLLGLGLGYILSRSYTGFAGSVNRMYKNGSTKLMRTMMFMFVITAIANVGFLMLAKDITEYSLWINPINIGLLVGGVLFGIGMSFSSCCASGVMTDLAVDTPRAGITIIFFCIGVFVGFPMQTKSWVTNSWFTTATGSKFAQGAYLPDYFKWDGLNGYLGAVIVTVILASVVSLLAYMYEKKRKQNGTYHNIPSELSQDSLDTYDSKEFAFDAKTYDYFFKKPWTLKQGAIGMTIIFVLMMGLTKSGWGASTPYGFWFGKALNIFGVPAESLASFTKLAPETFSAPFLNNPVTVQNLGIFLGALVFILTSGLFKETMHAVTTLNMKNTLMFAIGGFVMGFGTRLSNGCNVGALYSPIAQFSVSGWIFFVVLVLGGIIGNAIAKKVYANN